MSTIEQQVGILLRKLKLTLGTVESATGGLISHRITNIPGSSDYYRGSITSYSNEIKTRLVGVKKQTLEKYGAVSAQVAREMAQGGRQVLRVDICIADTGIAGPGGDTPQKPLGLFYLGLSHKDGTFSRKHIFQGDRRTNKQQAAEAALSWLLEYLRSLDSGKIPEAQVQTKRVVTCFLESNGKILILRRSHKVGTYQGKWAGISGYLEKAADDQAFTEIKEETGLGKRDIELILTGKPLEVIDPHIEVKWIVHPYLFRVKKTDKIKIDWEHLESKWINPDELDNYLTVPKLKETLQAVWQKES